MFRLSPSNEGLNLNTFHFIHSAASRRAALFMSWILLDDTDYQHLVCVCVCVCQDILSVLSGVFLIFCYSHVVRGDVNNLHFCQYHNLFDLGTFVDHILKISSYSYRGKLHL